MLVSTAAIYLSPPASMEQLVVSQASPGQPFPPERKVFHYSWKGNIVTRVFVS